MDEPEEGEEEGLQSEAAALDAFERVYRDDRTWEALQEDEHGRLRGVGLERRKRARARKSQPWESHYEQQKGKRARRGLIRSLVLAIDCSRASQEADMRPSRLTLALRAAHRFVQEFFDQNPLSQLAIHLLRGGVSESATSLSASPQTHLAILDEGVQPHGELSIQNCLENAVRALEPAPAYGTKEVIVLQSGLSSCDPGDVYGAVNECQRKGVRASFIGMGAEVFLCRRASERTRGKHGVATDADHLLALVRSHAPPPLESSGVQSALVRMGFPSKAPQTGQEPRPAALGERGGELVCPRCKALAREVPSKCSVCGLALVASPHLARSFHHLFPVAPYADVPMSDEPSQTMVECSCCLSSFFPSEEEPALRCHSCGNLACASCDAFVHEGLHNCPGCELNRL